jgi:peptidoglycan/LPS O-acetylase OafA/YrhL
MTLIVDPLDVGLPSSYLTATWGLLGNVNNYFLLRHEGYFEAGINTGAGGGLDGNPFMHMWSLGVEEQFYVVFPLILWWVRGATAHRRVVVLSVIAGLSALASAVCTPAVAPGVAFYTMPTRGWQLLAGAIAHEVHPSLARRPQGAAQLVLELAALLLLLLCTTALAPAGEPGFAFQCLPTLGALCCIGAGSFSARGVAWRPSLVAALGSPVAAYLGRISYPVYLWHWSVIVLYKDATGTTGHPVSLAPAVALVATTLALAALTYHLFEKPIRRWRPSKTWGPFAALLPAVCVSLLVISALSAWGAAFWSRHQPQIYDDCPTETSLTYADPAANDEASLESVWAKVVRRPSESWSATHRPAVYVIGESHAQMWEDALRAATCNTYDTVTITVGMWYCDWMCDANYAAMEAALSSALRPDDLLIFSYRALNFRPADSADAGGLSATAAAAFRAARDRLAYSRWFYDSRYPNGNGQLLESVAPTVQRYAAFVRRMADVAARRNASVVVLSDSPVIDRRGTSCVTVSGARVDECCQTEEENPLQALTAPIREEFSRVAATADNLYFFDYLHLFCNDSACGPSRCGPWLDDGFLGLYDTNHMRREAGVKLMRSHLLPLLRRIVGVRIVGIWDHDPQNQ